MKKIIIFIAILVSLLAIVGWAEAEEEIVGKIVAVNYRQNTILLKNKDGIREYKVNINTLIYLNNKPVSLKALRPITVGSFQQAKLKLNNKGQVKSINSFYRVKQIKIEMITKQKVVVRDLNTGKKRAYNINNKVEVERNNYSTKLLDVKEGDQGIAILGINNRLQKLVLHHYEISGMLKEIDYEEKEITINVGSRLDPKLKTFALDNKTKIFNPQGKIRFFELSADDWIKLEVEQGVKMVMARKI